MCVARARVPHEGLPPAPFSPGIDSIGSPDADVFLALRLLVRWRHGYLDLHAHPHAEQEHRHPVRTPFGAFGIGLVHGLGGSAGVGRPGRGARAGGGSRPAATRADWTTTKTSQAENSRPCTCVSGDTAVVPVAIGTQYVGPKPITATARQATAIQA